MLSPEGRLRDVGVVGLGAGALAGYVGNGMRMDFFEVDDAVIRIAENPLYFTYLADARARPSATVRTMAMDGRLGLRAMPEAAYDLIVVDAFSSDAIPTHLLTREALAIYESRLKARGVMAFHVSSRFFDFRPVLARLADDLRLVCYAREDRVVPPERDAAFRLGGPGARRERSRPDCALNSAMGSAGLQRRRFALDGRLHECARRAPKMRRRLQINGSKSM